jgi:hypothetical protein
MTAGAGKDRDISPRKNRVIQAVLRAQGCGAESERMQTVLQWTVNDLPAPVTPQPGYATGTLRLSLRSRLQDAVTIGLWIFDDFNARFVAYFGEDDAEGARSVRWCVRKKLGYSNPRVVDAILDRIRDRRIRLLNHFKAQHQGSLLNGPRFEPGKLEGYFRRVVQLESLKVSPDGFEALLSDIEGPNGGPLQYDNLRPIGPGSNAENDTFDHPAARWGRVTGLLAAFWDESRGFRDQERLQGLAQLLMGEASGNHLLAVRCRAFWEAHHREWNERKMRRAERSGPLFIKKDFLENQLRPSRMHCIRPEERRKMENDLKRVETKLLSLQRQAEEDDLKCLPRREDMKGLLQGLVSRPDAARTDRIRKECKLLEGRARAALAALLSERSDNPAASLTRLADQIRTGPKKLPASLAVLARRIQDHLARRPSPTNSHGLDESERRRRKEDERRWLEEGDHLAAELGDLIRSLETEKLSAPSDLVRAVLGASYDVHDFLVYGRRRDGVIAALRRLPMRRLWNLLR